MPRRNKPTLGQQIKAARIAAQLTQTELGEQIGVTQTFIARIEGDKTRPNLRHLTAIAKATGCRFVVSDSGTRIFSKCY